MNSSIALFVCLVVGADTPADDTAKKEMGKFQGTWTVISLRDQDGVQDKVKGKQVTFTDKEMKFNFTGKDVTSTFRLNPSKTPHHFDLLPSMAPDDTKWVPGIYEINGDTLRICHSDFGFAEVGESGKTGTEMRMNIHGQRPGSFDDEKAVRWVLKRGANVAESQPPKESSSGITTRQVVIFGAILVGILGAGLLWRMRMRGRSG